MDGPYNDRKATDGMDVCHAATAPRCPGPQAALREPLFVIGKRDGDEGGTIIARPLSWKLNIWFKQGSALHGEVTRPAVQDLLLL